MKKKVDELKILLKGKELGNVSRWNTNPGQIINNPKPKRQQTNSINKKRLAKLLVGAGGRMMLCYLDDLPIQPFSKGDAQILDLRKIRTGFPLLLKLKNPKSSI